MLPFETNAGNVVHHRSIKPLHNFLKAPRRKLKTGHLTNGTCVILFIILFFLHYDDVIMTMLASQITSLTVVYSIVYSDVNQRKHQSSASLAFVREIHRGPVNFPHKWPVTRKMFPFDDVIMLIFISVSVSAIGNKLWSAWCFWALYVIQM